MTMNRLLCSVPVFFATAALVVVSAGLSAGCTVKSQGAATGADGGGATSEGGPAAAPPGLSCMQILQCIVACPASDAPCPDACADKGDAEGKANVLAFAQCVDTQKCTDAACTQDKCAASLDACVTSSAPKNTGTPLQGSAPPGSVPADLVGTWAGARDGITERLVFKADGSGTWRSSIVTDQSSCFSFRNTTRTGNAVITDSTITLYATSVVESVQQCSPPAADTNKPASTEQLKYSRPSDGDANTILVIDNACAAKYPGQENCNTLGCPIGLYCTSRLKRE